MTIKEFNIATWNVRSMLEAGKMEEIADELKKYNIHITALQEVR
jgi:exonuclease III